MLWQSVWQAEFLNEILIIESSKKNHRNTYLYGMRERKNYGKNTYQICTEPHRKNACR